jgi:hypothetical protein
MLKKCYISTLVIVLALFGIFSQQQVVLPNQEIVIQFTNAEVTTEDVQNTTANIKKQLQDLGVDNIQVKQFENGNIKITYFSDANVASIKEMFSKEENLALDFNTPHQNSNEFPSDEDTIAYNLDVYEIQDGNDVDWNLNGINIVKIDTKSDRFFEPNSYLHISNIEYTNDDILRKQAYEAYKNIAFTLNHNSKSIPEVRAGPIC